MESESNHVLCGAKDVRIAKEKIQVGITSRGRIAIGEKGKKRAFDQNNIDLRLGKFLQDAKKFCGHAEREEMLGTHFGTQFFTNA